MDAYRRARMVISATEDNDEITPVYRLEEICDLCRSSPPEVIKDVVDHVMRRLDSRSPYVKQKALRLIKYASGKAGPDFKRDMQRHSGTIRGYFHYKGQPDPLKGDAPNKAVRDTAHETVQAMFSTEPSRQEGPSAHPHRRMEGFGSQGTWDPGANANRAPAGIGGYISAGMKELETAVLAKGGLKDMVQGAVNQYTGRGSRRSFLSEENDRGSFRPPRSNEDAHSWGGGESYRDSQYGGKSNGDYNRGNGSFGRGASAEVWTNNQADDDDVDDDVSMSGGGLEAGSSKGPASAEERLVDGITAPGGVRPSPTREALQAFMNAAATLDGELLGRSLEGKLRSQRWQVRFRALCVIEALQRHEGGGGIASAKEHFTVQPQAVMDNLDSPQASVREKAKKVLTSLGLADAAPTMSSPSANVALVADLLDTSEPAESPTVSSSPLAEASAVTHKPQTSAPSTDLLGDAFWSETPTSAPPPQNQPSGADLFIGLTVDSSDGTQKQGGGDSSELFAGMNLEGGMQAQPTTSAAQPSGDLFNLSPPRSSPGGVDSLSDLLGGLSVAPPQATPSAAPSSGGVRSPPQTMQPLPPMFGNSQSQQLQSSQGLYPPQAVPGMMPFMGGPQQMTPQQMQQMQQMQMAYLHQMQQRGMAPIGMMPFPQPGFGQGLQPGFGGFMPQVQFGHAAQPNGSHLGGTLQPSGGSLGGSSFSSLGAGGSGDLFLNAGIAHSQENKAETKAFDFIADQLKTAKTGRSMR